MKRLTYIFTMLLLMLGLSNSVSAQTWEFSSMSEEDKEALNADTENWTYESTNNRWKNAKAIDNAGLTANGKELEFTKGLVLNATAADQIRLDNKKGSLTLNNKQATITVKNLTAGQSVKVISQSSSSTTKRSISASNVTVASGFGTESTERLTSTGTVTADGDITLSVTGGTYIYSIVVEDADNDDEEGEEGEEDTPRPASDDHSTFASAANNQVVVTLDGAKKYYNTKDVTSIDIADNVITVNQNGSADTYTGTIKNLSFKKATEGNNGQVENQEGRVKITEARGWFESAFVKFDLFEGAKSYNVYIKGGNYSEYTKIDEQLVRNYGTYGRADVLGLVKADNYAIKVVPVDENKTELTAATNEAVGISVVNYDRSGFAHKGRTEGIGAYNNDGSLKAGANVVYVTKNNAKTVSLEIASGSNGKTATYTGFQQLIYGYQKGDANGSYEKKPLCIRIIGTISANDCDEFLSSAEGIQIKGAKAYMPMNITIEGVGDDATTTGFGFLIRNAASIELRNFANMLCMDDAVSIDTDNSNIWVHNLDLFYGNTGGDADQAKGDGTIDMKGDSKFITVSYNHLWDSGKASLCGMKSETGPNWITYHHNWFDHSDSRHPRIRTMSVHAYNNYYDGNAKYGVGAAYKSNAFVEANYFRNCKYPMLISLQGSDVATNPKGTFSGEDGGMIKSFGNKIIGAIRYTTYQQNKTEFDAYEATTRDDQVPATVAAKVGGRTYDNFDTDASLFYTYTPDAAEEVPGIVTGWMGAGRMAHGDFQWTFDNATEDANYNVIAGLKSALQSYKTKLVGIFGDENAESGEQGGEGGNEGGEGGEEGGEQGGTILASFDGKASNTMFTVEGNYGDGKITYNEVYYKKGVKFDSKGSITFTPTQDYNMTIILGTAKSGKDVAINGTKTTVSGTTNTEGAYYEMEPIAITKGTQYVLSKGSSEALVMLIKLEPVGE